ALKLATGSGVPPREEEFLPLGPAHRTHLSATPIARVAVDAREQPPRAPLLAAVGLELPADREPARAKALQSAEQGPVGEPPARGPARSRPDPAGRAREAPRAARGAAAPRANDARRSRCPRPDT